MCTWLRGSYSKELLFTATELLRLLHNYCCHYTAATATLAFASALQQLVHLSILCKPQWISAAGLIASSRWVADVRVRLGQVAVAS